MFLECVSWVMGVAALEDGRELGSGVLANKDTSGVSGGGGGFGSGGADGEREIGSL